MVEVVEKVEPLNPSQPPQPFSTLLNPTKPFSTKKNVLIQFLKMAKPLHFDKIEEYLTGQMPEDRAHAFEQEAANNPQLATELELQRLEHDAMERMLERELKNKKMIY